MQKGTNTCTAIIGGKQFQKDHPLIECLGTIDELNAFLGDAKTAVQKPAAEIITAIQKELFALSGVLAGSKADVPGEQRLNALIAEMEENHAPFAAFAVPGENPASAKLHIARTVCRRAERRLVSLERLNVIPALEYKGILAWFNRLSYLLFLLAQKEAGNRERGETAD